MRFLLDTNIVSEAAKKRLHPKVLRPRGYPDTQIAAVALARNLTLVTRNTEDFPEMPVVNPFED